MPGLRLFGLAGFAAALALAVGVTARPAAAQSSDQSAAEIPTIEVIGVSPMLGTGVPRDQVPANVQTLDAKKIEADHAQSMPEVLSRNLGSATVSDSEGNPFQQDLNFRGFTASPVLGTPQGIAVYQNGVRINEPFGDVVFWDFVPLFAINELQLIPGSNPVFGLNALGGAASMEMKTGFTFQGTALDLSGGSFGRVEGTAEYGVKSGDVAGYVGVKASHEAGWRDFSPSTLTQAYADISVRKEKFDLGASLTLAGSGLEGNGATPAQELAIDRDSVFTIPDTAQDRLFSLSIHGNYQASDTLALQGTTYFRHTGIATKNGDASGFAPCTTDGTTLCENVGAANETSLVDRNGNPISSSLGGTAITGIQNTTTDGLGASLQLVLTEPLLRRDNTAVVGASFDYGNANFRNATELGNLGAHETAVGTGLLLGTGEYNTQLNAQNRYYGLYATDTLRVTDKLSATLAGRLNVAEVDLADEFGSALTGSHNYSRLNPSLGLTYQLIRPLNLYASYGEANRIPTAAELGCANPAVPCRFPAGFISDPSLRQVVARTVELGARGKLADEREGLVLNWSADVFGTRNQDDIIFVSSGPIVGSGFFRNAGVTQRLGAEAALDGRWGKFSWFASYALTKATFQSHLAILSPNNPGADANGNIFVKPGDRLPDIPLHSAKLGVGYQITERWSVALDGIMNSSRYLRGDEANLQHPLGGYVVFNAHTSYRVTKNLELYLEAENLLDSRYNSFGIYGDPTTVYPNFTDNRFLVPGQPFGIWAGMRARF